MSEIVRVEDPPVLRFGKHAGKSAAEVMATDPDYVQWVLAQPWFQEKNPRLVQFFVSGAVGGVEQAETPEHNALQAKFTQDAYCLAAAAMFSAGQRLLTSAATHERAARMMWSEAAPHVLVFHPQITGREFELHAWDVQFQFWGARAVLRGSVEPDCTCEPLEEPEPLQPEPVFVDYTRHLDISDEKGHDAARGEYTSDHTDWAQAKAERNRILAINRHRVQLRFKPSVHSGSHLTWDEHVQQVQVAYAEATRHEDECPRATLGYLIAWPLAESELVGGGGVRLGLELKPTMGDDYPAVLRQVQGYLRRRGMLKIDKAAVVVGEFRSAAVPWSVVRKQFWESKILLIKESELGALVENHADEWGAGLRAQEEDFTVDFAEQL
jgi:hypothetical protein